jgi:hypothetical protein
MAGGFTWTGQDVVLGRRLPASWAKFSAAAGKTLYNEGRAILAEAKRRTPVDTGDLKRSGFVRKIDLLGGGYTVIIGFNMPYALIVHEDLTVFHATGQAKYLEEPFRLAAASMRARLQAGANEGLK